MMRRLVLATVAAAAVTAGCSSGGASSGLSDAAATTLQADVLSLTQAVADHRWTAAEQLIAQLRRDLASATAAGDVAPARAAAIRASLAAVSRDLVAARPSTTPTRTETPTHTSTPTHTAAPPPAEDHHGKGKGKGHDH